MCVGVSVCSYACSFWSFYNNVPSFTVSVLGQNCGFLSRYYVTSKFFICLQNTYIGNYHVYNLHIHILIQ